MRGHAQLSQLQAGFLEVPFAAGESAAQSVQFASQSRVEVLLPAQTLYQIGTRERCLIDELSSFFGALG